MAKPILVAATGLCDETGPSGCGLAELVTVPLAAPQERLRPGRRAGREQERMDLAIDRAKARDIPGAIDGSCIRRTQPDPAGIKLLRSFNCPLVPFRLVGTQIQARWLSLDSEYP